MTAASAASLTAPGGQEARAFRRGTRSVEITPSRRRYVPRSPPAPLRPLAPTFSEAPHHPRTRIRAAAPPLRPQAGLPATPLLLFAAYEWAGADGPQEGDPYKHGTVVVLAYLKDRRQLSQLSAPRYMACRAKNGDTGEWEKGVSGVTAISIEENHIYDGVGVLIVCNTKAAAPSEVALVGSDVQRSLETTVPVVRKRAAGGGGGGGEGGGGEGGVEGAGGEGSSESTRYCLTTLYGSRLSVPYTIEWLLYTHALGIERIEVYDFGDMHPDMRAVRKGPRGNP